MVGTITLVFGYRSASIFLGILLVRVMVHEVFQISGTHRNGEGIVFTEGSLLIISVIISNPRSSNCPL